MQRELATSKEGKITVAGAADAAGAPTVGAAVWPGSPEQVQLGTQTLFSLWHSTVAIKQ